MGIFSRILESLRERGLRRSWQTLLSIIEDWLFDRVHGTDTMARLQQEELDFEHPAKASAHPYFPTRGRAVRKLLASIDFPPGSVLVDYGSGKGKVLLLAARFNFREVVGIEFSEELNAIAEANVRRFGGEAARRIRLVCADAAAHVLRDDENVFYFFNPFEQDVMSGVSAQIRASLARRPRHIYVIYFDPRFLASIRDSLGLRQTRTFVYGGYEVAVLENT